MLGPGSIAVIGLAALVMFGPKKLPELGKAAGKTLREFKNATKGMMDEEDDKKESEQLKK
ncbi:MAG: twin-arginine translocase TatA/TatE family subunit [Bacillota bacterium]|jgi:sec-independent protein translocase protein TatA|uniref:Sec-independent protein translocase protein TatA n=3 Tax=Bacteria TaxID=2 RepID=A0A8J6UE45_9FLAO|nr:MULTISPECIES: twin-arginine translocase TatA/TatE family subunit [Bacteria]MBD0825568.1 twin-arginine translocase TatA/TatE family subunit [Aestuariibaculum marinum]MBH0171639.1 twin-arginine translocase TatA/TatE family subunit [Fictibacillus sp. 18YEL24]MED1863852.1 twin-arginine translocase TatA/TatE family subunit [Fictibacillus nanhaiensis]RGP35033.1 twin-arginine translocase TatA/TatE family subunit [Pseudotabrizicola alkalilacus]